MNKPFYSDYVRHALRYYTRNISVTHFKSDVDKQNWIACDKVMKAYSGYNQSILISVYSGHDTLADEVYNISKKCNIEQGQIWDMMKECERKIARKRQLL